MQAAAAADDEGVRRLPRLHTQCLCTSMGCTEQQSTNAYKLTPQDLLV
jgi:hypothetical protein